jgi:hypothetical protein
VKTFLIVIILFVLGGFMLPADYSTSKNLQISASADVIHNIVQNMDNWGQWTVWEQANPPAGLEDPGQMQSGAGSSVYFKGQLLSGWFVIKSSSASEGFYYDVVAEDGSKAKGAVSYLDNGGVTNVNWTMAGKIENPVIIAPYLALLMDFIVGSALNQNLVNLKEQVKRGKS